MPLATVARVDAASAGSVRRAENRFQQFATKFQAHPRVLMVKFHHVHTHGLSFSEEGEGHMNSKIASDEGLHFRDRLQSMLRQAGVAVRASTVAHEFNLRAHGATVTTHAVRKWLAGDAIPTHERLLILASWLGVHASWLLYGDAENGEFSRHQAAAPLQTRELILVRDFQRLTPSGQQVLRAVLDALLRTMAADSTVTGRQAPQR